VLDAMACLIRKANERDISQLEKLLVAYMRETYQGAWGGNAPQIKRDLLDKKLEIIVAENAGKRIVGFIAWVDTYDLHWCLTGGEIIDFYVVPESRGRGVGLLLAIALASEIQKRGGRFLKGGAVENDVVRRFYGRIAMCFPDGTSYVSGRAFRHLAGLAGKNVREIVRNLPPAAWNYEP